MTTYNRMNTSSNHLTEFDVAGASLNGKRPEDLKVPALKLWLKCRGAPIKGKKSDLVERFVLVKWAVTRTYILIEAS